MTLGYDPASGTCAGKSQPGARALMAWALDTFVDARNLGIYVCRAVRGGTAKSVHADGRAGDTAFPLDGGLANPHGHDLAALLVLNAERLGVQLVIFDQLIWTSKSRTWRAHCGHRDARGPHDRCSGPHLDHVHWELTWDAARNLTRADIDQIFGDTTPPPEDDMAAWSEQDSENLAATRKALEQMNHHISGKAEDGSRLARLVRAAEGVRDAAVAIKAKLVGG